jgi:ribosomal subunit interface protein
MKLYHHDMSAVPAAPDRSTKDKNKVSKMQLTVKGQHLDVGDALREHVRENLTLTAKKFFTDPVEAIVTITKEKNHRYKADISIHVSKGLTLEAQHEADEPYPAFDIASQRLAKRLGRYKDKLRDHHRQEKPAELLAAAYTTFQSNDEEEAGDGPAVIAEMQTQVPVLAVSDAVMRLELSDQPALLFKNPAHGGYNMVYRRKDGNIGWVDPNNGKKA